MNIIAVDDERPALRTLERAIAHVARDAKVTCFESAGEALAYAKEKVVDIAFLDVEMDEMNGLQLAKALKDICGNTNIIFVTGYSQYTVNAFSIHASGYVLKPINPERVSTELKNLRYPVRQADTGVRIRCFGSFEVFSDGAPIPFGRPKAKEMLAYLVDRQGANVSKRELASVLWENELYTRSIQSHLHVLFSDMTHALEAAGAGDIVIRNRGQYAINTQKANCDYYRYCAGDTAAVNSYRGEYMTNYSWAEFTAAALARRL